MQGHRKVADAVTWGTEGVLGQRSPKGGRCSDSGAQKKGCWVRGGVREKESGC